MKSTLEKGVSRFDVLRRVENIDDFLLIEVYNDQNGANDHKTTNHYNVWRENVAELMENPRSAKKYNTIFPSKEEWKTEESASQINVPKFMSQYPWSVESPIADNASPSGSGSESMLAVLVDVQVTPESVTSFITETLLNCQSSVRESGVHRFDLLQNTEDECNFVLVEVYNSESASAAHKATSHYLKWRESVEKMMARARTAEKYLTLFPAPLYWHKSVSQTHFGDNVKDTWSACVGRGLDTVSGHSFSFIAPRVVFGRHIAKKQIEIALQTNSISKPLIVTGNSGRKLCDELLAGILSDSQQTARFLVTGEPTVEDAQSAVTLALEKGCDGVLAVGGGSCIDLGKAVSALVTNKGDIYDYLEVVGKGQPIQQSPLPFIAVPTTSGTGSEVTKNAVLKSTKHQCKVSIRHDTMLPSVAIIDPSLSFSCPPAVTAAVGLDALCQVIEPYTSNAANPFTDALAREGILRGARSLRAVVANGNDAQAREDMSVVSVLGGLCLANAKLGAVHGFASVLGGRYEKAAHGAVCAALLPYCFQKNALKLRELADNGDEIAATRLQRFLDVARIITGNPTATVEEGSRWLIALVRDVGIPSLSQLCGMKVTDIEEIARASLSASSTKGNPVSLTEEDMRDLLREAF
eukprot:CAMPEP_0182419024 /NCGR_PEP_ID=MMETSP1167-20130531/3408_1 /TAXON_ID=2988 /ORGANISM="Mallomonas Sp, Strain CCMP3275" /LENGTH=638 /DNA_ID=CAMNT_0024593585 /DNA_START=213 /DNA_END=2129 /DNA_ORIENTATION=+